MYAKILPGLELERKIWARKSWGIDWWEVSRPGRPFGEEELGR